MIEDPYSTGGGMTLTVVVILASIGGVTCFLGVANAFNRWDNARRVEPYSLTVDYFFDVPVGDYFSAQCGDGVHSGSESIYRDTNDVPRFVISRRYTDTCKWSHAPIKTVVVKDLERIR